MKNKKRGLLLILCFSFIFFIIPSKAVYAEDDGSLNITLSYDEKTIRGAVLSVYQVADLKADKSGYTIKDPFQWEGAFTDFKTADEQLKLSLDFEKQSRNVKETMESETDDSGVVNFTGLKGGVYLVVQTGAEEEAKNYTNIRPFLVMIPQFENGVWNESVNAKPKTEIQSKDKPEIPQQLLPDKSRKTAGKLPKTGDTVNMFWWSGLLLISGVSLFFLRKRR